MYKNIVLIIFLTFIGITWGGGDRVKLKDVDVITLHNGQMTTSRRSYAVPQIKCVGGSAGCKFVPEVVQCKNSGFDGYDVQWECKADMEDIYKFGRIEVVCEGYDYPEDPYVLRGSCGFEYNLEFTEKGRKLNQGNSYKAYDNSYNWNTYSSKKNPLLGNIILFAMIALIIYGIYKTCLTNNQYSPTDDGSSPHQGGRPSGNTFGAAPGPGFRPEFMPNEGCGGDHHTSAGTGGAGGFWTGAATGGLLGYLFGSRNTGSNYYQSHPGFSQRNDWGWGSSSGSHWGGSSPSHFTNTNTETRTTTGYGGTRRR